MPAASPISINDGKATPVAHVFNPVEVSGLETVFVNRASGILGAEEVLRYTVSRPKSATGAYRVVGSLTRPIVQTVNGVDTVVRQNKTNFDFNFARDSTLAERTDDTALIMNLFANSSFRGAVQNAEAYW